METAAPLPDLVLWRSDRCHLCEETAELLAALMTERAAAGRPVPAVVVRRIAEDPAVERELHDHVPVLETAGRRLLLATRLGPVRAFLDEAYG
jgi:hypothetical protein